ncbi:unnamed protein product [Adineta ricciae]|uniref:ADP ribosyltransferase domain-containing protein n=1 Tax=Adineta ricciae TaxID=249248 RepID=A0A813TMS4_ADIRI|nr:unnamed protein product [Adineta ricciae]CAF1353608.1 unnamed protein product [Adineta ricciae]
MLRRKSVTKASGNAGSMANVFCLQDMQSQHNELNGEFLLYQVILKRLLSEGLTDLSKKATLIEHFDPTDATDQQIMKEFDTSYDPKKAIYWYTRESCIYRLLNKALRTQSIGDLIAFTQFIRDLYNQLAYEQITFLITSPTMFLTVYRGQMISVDEVNRIKYAKGQLLSMNSFLSTSTNRKQALEFAMSGTKSETLTTILLEIKLDLRQSSRPYADVKNLSAFAKEDEVLFMFGCVFRIDQIWFDKELKIWRANLTLCGDEDGDLTRFEVELERELEGKNMLVCLGLYMMQMQKFDEAEAHYKMLLKEKLIKEDFDLATCYHGLAQVNEKKGDYDDARRHLDLAMNYLSNDSKNKEHFLVGQCHNDLGLIHSHQENYPLAFHHYEQALKFEKNNHSMTYAGLAKLHYTMGNYKIALEYQYKCLQHQTNTTRPSFIANTYIELGKIFTALKQFEKAKSIFQKAIQTQQQALFADHPDLGYTYIAMGQMYSDFDQESKAFECIQKAYDLQAKSLPNNHSDFAVTFKNFGFLYQKKGDYEQALHYFNKLLENQLKTLLWKHPAVGETYSILGKTYLAQNNYDQALDYLDKLLKNQLERLNIGNPAITETYNTIANTYLKKDNIEDALDYFRKSLKNDLERKLPDDPSLIELYRTIANLHLKLDDYPSALIHFNRLVDAQARVRPVDEEAIDETYEIIGKIYAQNNFFETSLLYFGNSLITKMQNSLLNRADLSDSFRMIESVHFEKRHLDQALRYFQQLLKIESAKLQSGDARFSHLHKIIGNILLEKQNMEEALTSFENVMNNELKTKSSTDPKLYEIYEVIGNINVEIHNYDQALIYLKKLLTSQLEKVPRNYRRLADLYKYVANIYLDKLNYPQALIHYNHLLDCQLEIKVKELNATLSSMGKIFCNYDRFASTTKSKLGFVTTINLPRSLRIASLTESSIEQRHFDRLIDYFEQLITKKTSLSDSYQILAHVYLEIQSFDEALKYFRKALHLETKVQPSNDTLIMTIYKFICIIYFEQHNLSHSMKYLQKLLHKLLNKTLVQDPSLADIYHLIAVIYFKQRNLSHALLYLNLQLDCHAQAKSNEKTATKHAFSYIKSIYLACDYFPKPSLKSLSLTSIKLIEGKYFDQRHRDQSIEYFHQILKEQIKTLSTGDSLLSESYNVIANINLCQRNYNQALLFYYKLLANESEEKTLKDLSLADIYRNMAYIYFDLEIYDEALLFFNRLIHCRIENSDLLINEIYTMIGKIYSTKHIFFPTDAVSTAEHWKQLIQSQTEAERKPLNSLYEILHNKPFKSYYRDRALDHFLKLLRLQIDSKTSMTVDMIYLIIANIHYEKRDYNQALYYFNKSIESNTSRDSSLADIYTTTARIHFQKGHFNQAIADYRLALIYYKKDSSAASHKIEQVKRYINESILQLEN